MELSAEGFDALVTEELDDLADEIVAQLDNIVFVTEDISPDGDMQLLGIYEGIALTERGQYGFGELPDRIVLFRLPLLSVCDTEVELRHEIHVTLVHEIAHFYGLTDDELHELGWA